MTVMVRLHALFLKFNGFYVQVVLAKYEEPFLFGVTCLEFRGFVLTLNVFEFLEWVGCIGESDGDEGGVYEFKERIK